MAFFLLCGIMVNTDTTSVLHGGVLDSLGGAMSMTACRDPANLVNRRNFFKCQQKRISSGCLNKASILPLVPAKEDLGVT